MDEKNETKLKINPSEKVDKNDYNRLSLFPLLTTFFSSSSSLQSPLPYISLLPKCPKKWPLWDTA